MGSRTGIAKARIKRLVVRHAPSGLTPRVIGVCRWFGLEPAERPRVLVSNLTLELRPGTITLLVGPSGAGKTSILRELMTRFPAARDVGRVNIPTHAPLAEVVAVDRPLTEAVSILSACGLGEPRLWLRRADELSDGQRFRARLAYTLGLHLGGSSRSPVICDELAALLHRRAAQAVAFGLRKLVSRTGLCFVAASSGDDLIADLQPDRTVRLVGDGQALVMHAEPADRPISFAEHLTIEPASRREYDRFSAMHYRSRDELGFVDRCFVLGEGTDGEPLGIVVYGHSPLELRPRNQATGGRFKRNAHRLNREMRILKRLVIHPDVRGCGLGQRLVRETLPRVGTRFVECLANMGQINPVFERAGMRRIGVCEQPPELRRIQQALSALEVDALSPEFVSEVCRRPRVRRLVAAAVRLWYRGLTGGGENRVRRQSPAFLARTFRQMVGSAPVYYLWERPEMKDEG